MPELKGPNILGEVDINKASEEELAKVSSIGTEGARKIVEYREKNGPFGSVDDLKKVPGFPENLIQDLKVGLKI